MIGTTLINEFFEVPVLVGIDACWPLSLKPFDHFVKCFWSLGSFRGFDDLFNIFL